MEKRLARDGKYRPEYKTAKRSEDFWVLLIHQKYLAAGAR
jgi:hypothetical protein